MQNPLNSCGSHAKVCTTCPWSWSFHRSTRCRTGHAPPTTRFLALLSLIKVKRHEVIIQLSTVVRITFVWQVVPFAENYRVWKRELHEHNQLEPVSNFRLRAIFLHVRFVLFTWSSPDTRSKWANRSKMFGMRYQRTCRVYLRSRKENQSELVPKLLGGFSNTSQFSYLHESTTDWQGSSRRSSARH